MKIILKGDDNIGFSTGEDGNVVLTVPDTAEVRRSVGKEYIGVHPLDLPIGAVFKMEGDHPETFCRSASGFVWRTPEDGDNPATWKGYAGSPMDTRAEVREVISLPEPQPKRYTKVPELQYQSRPVYVEGDLS